MDIQDLPFLLWEIATGKTYATAELAVDIAKAIMNGPRLAMTRKMETYGFFLAEEFGLVGVDVNDHIFTVNSKNSLVWQLKEYHGVGDGMGWGGACEPWFEVNEWSIDRMRESRDFHQLMSKVQRVMCSKPDVSGGTIQFPCQARAQNLAGHIAMKLGHAAKKIREDKSFPEPQRVIDDIDFSFSTNGKVVFRAKRWDEMVVNKRETVEEFEADLLDKIKKSGEDVPF
jgi:hypothetical protein